MGSSICISSPGRGFSGTKSDPNILAFVTSHFYHRTGNGKGVPSFSGTVGAARGSKPHVFPFPSDPSGLPSTLRYRGYLPSLTVLAILHEYLCDSCN